MKLGDFKKSVEGMIEYRFQAQDDAQAAKILKEQTDHWSTTIEPSRSRSIYTDLKVTRK